MKRILLIAFCSTASVSACAGAIFSIVPNVTAQSSLRNGEIGTAIYQVTNNTQETLTNMTMARMPSGVLLTTSPYLVSPTNSSYCNNPFTLAPGESCLVKVVLNSTQMTGSIASGPIICYSNSKPVYCSKPFSNEGIHTQLSQTSIPQDCSANAANFNYELAQNFDTSSFVSGWGLTRAPLTLSPSNPNLTSCAGTAGSSTSTQLSWMRQRIVAAAGFWIAQKLNYCHHYNPDYVTPVSQRGAAGNAGGYCNPALDAMPGSVYYGQQARWNYSGQGSETLNNWVNNNRMWYGMDCSNYTAFLYNFSFGIQFDSKTGYQAGQATGTSQDTLTPNEQTSVNILNNPNAAGQLVCADGTLDGGASSTNYCSGHGGYISRYNSSGNPTNTYTPQGLSSVLQPGDILFIAGGGANPDGSTSNVTHAIMWLGKQVGYGANDINPALIAPDDAPCADPSIWQPQIGDWVINDSHYQGSDYRVLTSCFYLNNLWGVRRVIY